MRVFGFPSNESKRVNFKANLKFGDEFRRALILSFFNRGVELDVMISFDGDTWRCQSVATATLMMRHCLLDMSVCDSFFNVVKLGV